MATEQISKEANSALDAILDATLDDLMDAPGFEPFHPGVHRVTAEFIRKEINKHPSIEMKMKLLETMELADPSKEPQKPGSEASVAFMLDNEMGQGNLKAILKVLQAHFGTATNGATIEAAKGAELLVATKIRGKKDDPTVQYMQVVSVEVV